MEWKERQQPPLEGSFNTNYFVKRHGADGLRRIRKTNKDLFNNITSEYQYVGFTGLGGRVRRRSIEEQYNFAKSASLAGLAVLPPLSLDRLGVVFPFFQGTRTLDQFFLDQDSNHNGIIVSIISDLKRAHSKKFIYGDRWAGNILVDKDDHLLHIDFDLELYGSNTRELEVAQVAYHLLWVGGSEIIPILTQLLVLEQRDGWFDFGIFSRFIKGFASFLNNTKVGKREEEVITLLNSMGRQIVNPHNIL